MREYPQPNKRDFPVRQSLKVQSGKKWILIAGAGKWGNHSSDQGREILNRPEDDRKGNQLAYFPFPTHELKVETLSDIRSGWFIDSAETIHLINNSDLLHEMKNVDGTTAVSVGLAIVVEGIGTLQADVSVNLDVQRIVPDDVAFVPSLSEKLLPVVPLRRKRLKLLLCYNDEDPSWDVLSVTHVLVKK